MTKPQQVNKILIKMLNRHENQRKESRNVKISEYIAKMQCGRDKLLGVHIEPIRKHRRLKPLLKALTKWRGKGQITSERASSGRHATYRTRTSQRTPQGALPVKIHTRVDIAQLPIAHVHTHGHPKGSRDLRSLPVVLVLVLLYYILYYYYSKKKTREKAGHVQNMLPVMMSLPVTFSDFRSHD